METHELCHLEIFYGALQIILYTIKLLNHNTNLYIKLEIAEPVIY